MKLINRERLKFYLLLILIITSLLQVGILWSYQDHGFPISFFSKNARATESDGINAVKALLGPFRIVVSEGGGNLDTSEPSRWIIGNSKDSDYINLWNDGQQYLKSSLNINQQPLTTNISEWINLATSERTIIFDFKNGISQSLFLWLLDIKNISTEIPKEIHKVMIAPWQNSGTLYISDDSKIYSYKLNFDENKLSSYESTFNKYSNSEEKSFRKYTFIKELDPDNKRYNNFGDGVLVIIKGGQYSGIKNVYSSVPDVISVEKTFSTNQVDEIASAILGVEKDGYERTIDSSDNTIEFKTQNKIYKLYKNGHLEYKYLTEIQEADKGELKDVLVNTYKLLSRIKSIISADSNLYLSKVIDNPRGSYTFNFDYSIGGIPVTFISRKEVQNTEPAISIEANSKGILSCTARLVSFTQQKSETLYNMYFGDLQVELYKKNKELKEDKNIMIKDIRISYGINDDNTPQELKPVWFLETNNKNYIVPMYSK